MHVGGAQCHAAGMPVLRGSGSLNFYILDLYKVFTVGCADGPRKRITAEIVAEEGRSWP